MKIKAIFQRLVQYIQGTRTGILTLILIFIGAGFWFLLTRLYTSYNGEPLANALISLGFFFFGLSFLVNALRKEIDYFYFRIEGPVAVVVGIFFFILNIALASIPLLPRQH